MDQATDEIVFILQQDDAHIDNTISGRYIKYGNHEADLHLYFRICKNRISHGTAHFRAIDKLNSAPSPRVLNSHLTISNLPQQIFSKHTKIIHIMRNPKDMVTSFYHHLLQAMKYLPEEKRMFETFSDFLPYMTGEYGICK